MNYGMPVDAVVQLLELSGYHAVGNSIRLGTLTFKFAAVLVGTRSSHDLVVVVDTVNQPDEARTRRNVLAMARALDLTESRRTLTVITAGPALDDLALRELSRVCRVLSIGTPAGSRMSTDLRDALAVLLPLDLPQGDATAIDPVARLVDSLGAAARDTEVIGLLEAARTDAASVEEHLQAWLTGALPEDHRD